MIQRAWKSFKVYEGDVSKPFRLWSACLVIIQAHVCGVDGCFLPSMLRGTLSGIYGAHHCEWRCAGFCRGEDFRGGTVPWKNYPKL